MARSLFSLRCSFSPSVSGLLRMCARAFVHTCAPSTCVSGIHCAVWSESLYALSNQPQTKTSVPPNSPHLSRGCKAATSNLRRSRRRITPSRRCHRTPHFHCKIRARHLNRLASSYRLSLMWICLFLEKAGDVRGRRGHLSSQYFLTFYIKSDSVHVYETADLSCAPCQAKV